MTSIGVRSTSADFPQAIATAGSTVAGAKAGAATPDGSESNPEERLELALHELLGVQAPKQPPEIGPSLVVAAGDLDIGKTLNLLEASIGQMKAPKAAKPPKLKLRKDTLRVRMDHPIAQAQLGYVVTAPAPSSRDALAWRLLLYVLTHGYEGRLGMEAISKRGLLYYIDGQYRSDGENAFVSLKMGVDPAKLAPMEALLREQLELLRTSPPSEAELAEAKANLLGRMRSAAESNEEISARLALQWLWYGRLLEPDEIDKALSTITVRDLAKIAPAFTEGAFAVVSN
jgi:predicted Zn-dependent peptidase